MPSNLPSSLAEFLAAHGGAHLSVTRLTDMPDLVRLFQKEAPKEEGALSPENLAYLTALLDAIRQANEQMYEHSRAMVDLFRGGVFALEREALLAEADWAPLREKAVRMGLLPADLYGSRPAEPHILQPETYLRVKEAMRP